MRISKTAATLIISAILLSSCGTCPKPAVRQVDESDLDQWPTECTQHEDGTSTCPTKTLSWVYTTMGDLYFDSEKATTALKFANKKSDLVIEYKNTQLAQWHRRWYFSIPLGILIGGAAAATVFLVK